MSITAAQVKALRGKTGAGMMDCKKALQESDGDLDAAVKILREKGIAQAAKRADRVAAEGRVGARIGGDGSVGVLVELNCETDFVARNDTFGAFVDTLLDHIVAADPGGPEALAGSTLGTTGQSVAHSVTELTALIGEKVQARRYAHLAASSGCALGSYVHPGDRIAVLIELQGAAGADGPSLETILRDVALQIASMSPAFATRDEVDAQWLAQEQDIAMTQAREMGKPENVLERIAEGKVRARLKEMCLADQVFVKSTSKQTVAQYVAEAGKAAGAPELAVSRFIRFQLGEGVEATVGSEG